MKNQIPTYLLNKFLNGECTTEEEVAVENWYAHFENDPDYISSISELEKQELKKRIYSIINKNIHFRGVDAHHDHEVAPKQNKLRYIAYTLSGIAAILMISVGLFLLFSYHSSPKISPVEIVTITNRTKSIYEQTLSDGSHVWLNPGAQIKFNKIFTGNTREITLTGESFFEVTKNPLKPFIVTTKNIITKVWGTSFRIRDSKELNFADVAVVTGKVSVKMAPSAIYSNRLARTANTVKEVMIYPNQQITFLKKNNIIKTAHKADIKELHIWKKPNLSFDNKPLKEVMLVLNREFEVNVFSDDNKVNNDLLNADFNGLNFPEIMEIIRKTLNVRYEMEGQNVLLQRN